MTSSSAPDDILLDLSAAIAIMSNNKGEELCTEDELMDLFDGDTHNIFEAACETPTVFVEKLDGWTKGRYKDDSCVTGIRAWVTVNLMFEEREDPAKARKKGLYRAWLQKELKMLDEKEAEGEPKAAAPEDALSEKKRKMS